MREAKCDVYERHILRTPFANNNFVFLYPRYACVGWLCCLLRFLVELDFVTCVFQERTRDKSFSKNSEDQNVLMYLFVIFISFVFEMSLVFTLRVLRNEVLKIAEFGDLEYLEKFFREREI